MPTLAQKSAVSSLDSIAHSTIRQLLGWRYRADDTTGFLAALTKTIQLKEVEGHIEWDVQPQNYMVQADLGQVTGAQASVYARAQVALDQSLPLLNGLTLLGIPTADPEDMEATRAIIQTEFTALVNELGVVGGPRVQRIDSFFSQLLGPSPPAPIPPADPRTVRSQLSTLAHRFGLVRKNVNTIDDEQDFTNYLILYDYMEDFATSEGLQLVQEGGKDGVLAFRSILNQLEFLMFLATKESSAHIPKPVHGFHTSRVHRALQNIANFLELTEREANKIRRDKVHVLKIKSIIPSFSQSISQLIINGENIQSGVSVFLIDNNDPKKGFKGSVNATAIPEHAAEHFPEHATEDSTEDSTSISVTFSKPPPEGRYIVVVKNPDGQYAWRDDTLTAPAKAACVPSVSGYAKYGAANAIKEAHLAVRAITQVHSAAVASGNVISQFPPSGTSVEEGFPVNLVISSGPLVVPDVTAMTQAAATEAIVSAKLTVGEVSSAYSATVAIGNVISQYPTSGTSVEEGSSVNLVISSGPAKAEKIK